MDDAAKKLHATPKLVLASSLFRLVDLIVSAGFDLDTVSRGKNGPRFATDATAGAANGGGIYQLGEVEIEVAGGPPTREDGVLAGTVLTMIDAVRNLHALGIPLEDAVGAATVVPAKILGRHDVGVLEPGAVADVVVLDDRLDVVTVLCAGDERVVA